MRCPSPSPYKEKTRAARRDAKGRRSTLTDLETDAGAKALAVAKRVARTQNFIVFIIEHLIVLPRLLEDLDFWIFREGGLEMGTRNKKF